MGQRSKAREAVLQVLYQDDLNPSASTDDRDWLLQQRLKKAEAFQFARQLLAGVRQHRAEIDQRLQQIAANWSLHRMAVTDRNILRLGAYEILYGDTPGEVAIDEAVELAKRFGTAQSPQFVNGILDRLMHTAAQQAFQPTQPDKQVPGLQ